MNKLRVAYFGTPQFSADLLSMILEDKTLPIEIKLVITQPDKKVGRKQILTPSPVKVVAQKYNIPIIDSIDEINSRMGDTSEGSRQRATKRALTGRNEWQDPFDQIDLAILYAYGQIIPTNLLSIPKHGFWGVHPSLLPKYRGPSPMAFPLILGDTETGVTLMKMDEEIDHGPIIAQEKLPISSTDKRPDLENKLTVLAFNLFKNLVVGVTSSGLPTARNEESTGGKERVTESTIKFTEQNDAMATVTTLLNKNDGFIPFEVVKKLIKNEETFPEDLPKILTEYYVKNNIPLSKISDLRSKIYYNLFRGLYPWPGIWTLVNINNEQKRLKITDVDFINNQFLIKKVQLEGKTEVDFPTFTKAYKIFY